MCIGDKFNFIILGDTTRVQIIRLIMLQEGCYRQCDNGYYTITLVSDKSVSKIL